MSSKKINTPEESFAEAARLFAEGLVQLQLRTTLGTGEPGASVTGELDRRSPGWRFRTGSESLAASLSVNAAPGCAVYLLDGLPRLAFSAPEVAGLLGVTTGRVLKWIKAGRLKAVTGPPYVISGGALLELLNSPDTVTSRPGRTKPR